MKVRSRTRFRAAYAAPAIALLLLLVLPEVFPNRTIIDDMALARRQSVAFAFERAPHRLGPWVGKDVELPPAAAKLLRPNAILSRRFWRMDDDLALMDDMSHTDAFLENQEFTEAPLSDDIMPIGVQDAVLLLLETVGPFAPLP